MPHKHLDCPHCEHPVPVELDELMAAFAVPTCPQCHQRVYLTAGKLSNYQPGGKPDEAPGASAPYDPGE